MSRPPHPCKGCGFFRQSGAQKGCGYLDLTGKMRGCPFGEGCTIKDDPAEQARAAECKQNRRFALAYGRVRYPAQPTAVPEERNGGKHNEP